VDLSRPVGNSKRRRPPAGDLGHLRVLREGGDPAILVLHSGGVEILEWHAGWAAMAACKQRIAGRRATLGRRGSARFGRSGMDGAACEGEGAAFWICSVREPVARTRKPVSGSVDEKRPTERCQVKYRTSSFFLIVLVKCPCVATGNKTDKRIKIVKIQKSTITEHVQKDGHRTWT
jgi:hypothetical protein